jgi:hypothetical protein
MPEPASVAQQIRDGAFDGVPHAPASLARLLADTDGPERRQIEEALRQHVGAHLSSADPGRVSLGLTHLEVAARAGVPIALALVSEAHASLASAAWARWAAMDPGAADAQRTEVEQVADQAARRIASATCGAG